MDLAIRIFGDRPNKHDLIAVDYVSSLHESSSPTPKMTDYQAFAKAKYPTATDVGISKSWDMLKDYFTSEDSDHQGFQDMFDIPSVVAAFRAAPQTSTASTNMPPPPTPSLSSSRPSRALSSRSSSGSVTNSSSNGSSGNRNNRLTPDQVTMMHDLFKHNFDQFPGQAWTLPSGTTMDSLLYNVAMNQRYESALHSFILEDVKMAPQLAADDRDRHAIQSILIDRVGEHIPPLSAAETAFLALYCKAPDEVDELLSNGWHNMGAELDDKPTEEFRRVTHECVWAILTAYRQVDFVVPLESSESWFNHRLWWFLSLAFFSPHRVNNQPGEIASQASQHRRNEGRTLDSRQLTGHKADGLVYGTVKRLEYCVMEMAKKDQGQTGTKALNDTRKLAKTMKDMRDEIRKLATVDVSNCLVVYGMRIAGLTANLYTLRQRPGRFSQLCSEGSVSFPVEWRDEAATSLLLAVLAKVLTMRKAILAMAGQVPGWIRPPLDGSTLEQGDNSNWFPATLASPPYTPSQPATPVEDTP